MSKTSIKTDLSEKGLNAVLKRVQTKEFELLSYEPYEGNAGTGAWVSVVKIKKSKFDLIEVDYEYIEVRKHAEV